MNQTQYYQIKLAAYNDELEKISFNKKDLALAGLGGLAVGGAGIVGYKYLNNPQIKKELRDPRLYSNLRGELTLESREKRISAHKNLKKSDGTILGAMKAGWSRK